MSEQEQEKQSEVVSVSDNQLAEIRTTLARSRTFQAAERTFAAWIRTGFAVAGSGFTLGNILKETETRQLAWLIGGALIFTGILSFVFGWVGYKRVYDYIERYYAKRDIDTQPFAFSLFTVSVITAVLIISSVLGFYLMLS